MQPLEVLPNEEDTSNKSSTSSKVLTILLVCAVLFISSVSFEFPNAFLPLYNQERGILPEWNGLFIGFCCLGVVIACLITPSLMSTYPTKVLLPGAAIALGVSTIMFAQLDRIQEPMLYQIVGTAGRLVSGGIAGVLEVTSFAAIIAVYPEKIATVTAIGEGVLNAGLAFGPFLGSIFYWFGGFKKTFLIMGAIFSAASIPAAFCPVLNTPDTTDNETKSSKSNWSSILDPWLLFPFFHLTAVQVLNTYHYPIIAIYVQDVFGEDVVWTGTALLVNDVFICLSSPLMGMLIDKYGPYRAMLLSSILVPLSYMLIGPLPLLFFIPPSKAQLLVALSILGCVIPMGCIPAIPIAFDVYRSKHKHIPQWASDTLVSIYCSSFPLGGFIGSTMAGFMDCYFDFRWSTGTAALAFLVHSFICCLYCYKVKRRDVGIRQVLLN